MIGKRVVVILNRESGTMLALGPEVARDLLAEVFQRHGVEAEIQLLKGREIQGALEKARDGNADSVIVGGGDGTVASAATVMAGNDKPLGVLPLGTFNLAARDLGMPLDLEAAAEALITAPLGEADLLEVNGRMYFCVVVLGFYPVMALGQKEYHGNWMVKTFKTGWDVMRLLATYPPLDLVLHDGEKEFRCRTRFAALANNDYEDLMGLIPRRRSLDGGHLTVYVSRHRTRFGYVKSLVAWMMGRWRHDKEMTVFHASQLKISVKRKRRLAVMCDGEIEKLTTPFEVFLRPQALRVLAPRLAEPEAEVEPADEVAEMPEEGQQ
ncbi:diacylglycerol/lipid kinase family protein [Phragmitibacter flavus]|nr:diacylglycerol kinase family protein [Phragmitibacter flavus]